MRTFLSALITAIAVIGALVTFSLVLYSIVGLIAQTPLAKAITYGVLGFVLLVYVIYKELKK